MLKTKNLILRDFQESDIEKRIYWETVETEWQLWDGPWEYEGLSESQKKEDLEKYIENMHKRVETEKQLDPDRIRYQLQIDTNDSEHKYIGWISAYCIDDDCNYTDGDGYCTVGLDFPDLSVRGKGYSYEALCGYIQYLMEHGEKEIFLQTWSGNERMIHIVKKMGFEEYRRKEGLRMVRGKKYDGLTFRLNVEKLKQFLKKQ